MRYVPCFRWSRLAALAVVWASVALMTARVQSSTLAASADPLLAGFQNPPNSARPRVWWHWMNGNISQEGIKLDVPASVIVAGKHLWLDLGEVREIAEVAVNGKYLEILWNAPFRVDITSALMPGTNRITIQVTNLWVNRLIGDQQPWALKKYAFTDFSPYETDSPLLRSGLLGPVRLVSEAGPDPAAR